VTWASVSIPYLGESILPRDLAGAGGSFLQKPFLIGELTRSVREVLGGGR
jgi:hypothetical protein